MSEQAETPMADHIERFWNLLATEHVRILIDIRKPHEAGSGIMYHWDSASFPDDVAKALVAQRGTSAAMVCMTEPAEILVLAENIIEHGDNVAYPSRASSQYVRKVMRSLVEAFRDIESRALHAESVLAEQDSIGEDQDPPAKWLDETLRELARELLADPRTPWIGERDPKQHICWTAADRLKRYALTQG